MNFCPFCGSQLIENAKFCAQCGKSVLDMSGENNQETNGPDLMMIKHIDCLIAEGKKSEVWSMVTCENPYAYFALLNYIRPLLVKNEFAEELNEAQNYADKGNLMAQYLVAVLRHEMAFRKKNFDTLAFQSEKICNLATREVPPAMAYRGYFGLRKSNGVTNDSTDVSTDFLMRAVSLDNPEALYYIGCLYLKGEGGFSVDIAKAKRFLSRASIYKHHAALKMLESFQ